MTTQAIAAAMRRVQEMLHRRPDKGLHDDPPASARWQGGLCVASSHANGILVTTDVSTKLGGSGEHVTPGWLMRAGLASCLATRIAMGAAVEGIELTALEVVAASRSDARGIFGMAGAEGQAVPPRPCDVQLVVRIGARAVAAPRLRALVESCHQCSPVADAISNSVPLTLQIDVEAG